MKTGEDTDQHPYFYAPGDSLPEDQREGGMFELRHTRIDDDWQYLLKPAEDRAARRKRLLGSVRAAVEKRSWSAVDKVLRELEMGL
jgi:hypothetical protein